jgi:hypothetical protein
VPGLALPREVIDRIYYLNADRAFALGNADRAFALGNADRAFALGNSARAP